MRRRWVRLLLSLPLAIPLLVPGVARAQGTGAVQPRGPGLVQPRVLDLTLPRATDLTAPRTTDLTAPRAIGATQPGGAVLRESQPPEAVAEPAAPDTSVTATPLPPADQTDPAQDLVPNPLTEPPAVPAPGARRQTQPTGQPQRGGWVQMGTATLQALDKVNARGETLVLKVGDAGRFGSLNIVVRGCYVRTPDRPTDATAFLVIRDQRTDTPGFSGWMVRSAPYMSMLAHPIYDVRVAGCSP